MRVATALFALLTAASLACSAAAARNHAILVGVSGYQNERIARLKAPGNDVRRMWKMLTRDGRFAPEDIVVLADDTAALDIAAPRRELPTAERILAALDATAARVEDGDLVVFYFSGHGTFMPQPANRDPNAFVEPDGFDEVLLAIDAQRFDPLRRIYVGGIVDDVLKQKLDAIRRKAVVWAIIDSCNSGGATRSVVADVVYKSVDPTVLGLPARPALPAAATTAAAQEAMAGQRTKNEWIEPAPGAKPLVAFLAAAEDKEAIEREMEVEGEAGRNFSMFTHVLIETLARRGWDSYRQIARAMEARLMAESLPTPVFEGALDQRPFAGLSERPTIAASFDPGSGDVRIEAGSLAAYRAGSIVALRRGEARLGYARVTSARLDSSIARPEEHAGTPPPEPAALAEPMVAELVQTPVSFLLKVARPRPRECEPSRSTRDAGPGLAKVQQAVALLAARPRESFPIVWVEPGDRTAQMRLCVRGDSIYLVGGDAGLIAKGPGVRRPTPDVAITDSVEALAEALATKLWRVARYQNLLKIAAEIGENDLARAIEVKLRRFPEPVSGAARAEERRCGNIDKPVPETGGQPLIGGAGPRIRLTHCDRIAVSIRNTWDRDVDISLLYLDSQSGIIKVGDEKQVRLKARSADPQPYDPVVILTWCADGGWGDCDRVTRAGGSAHGPVGTEHLVIVATEATGAATRDFYFLAQEGLARRPDPTRQRGGARFETLLREGLVEGGTRSGVERISEAAIRVFTWEVVPPAQLPDRTRR